VDTVYHLAAQSNVIGSSSDPDYSFSTNVIGTYNVLKYSKLKNVKRLIFASSREVYGNPRKTPVDENHITNPINIYGSTKLAGENLCKAFQNDIEITILRIANAYGPGDKGRVIPLFITNALRNKDLQLYGGQQVLDFIFIDDLTRILIKVANKKKYACKTINIGTGKGTTIEALAQMITNHTVSKSKIVVKKARDIEVMKFISKSLIISEKFISLEGGLKRMIKWN